MTPASVTVVLASASPARLGVLRAAGIDPVVRVSGVDEDAVAAALVDPTPEQVVAALASAKANAVLGPLAVEFPDSVVLACDSMLHVNGEMVGKPVDSGTAARRWRDLVGGTSELLTGHAVARIVGGVVTARASGVRSTVIRFGHPSADDIAAYVATGEPLQVAGAFTLDGMGGWFVEGVDGDPSSVIGISLPLTRELLAQVGVPVTTLWRRGNGTYLEPAAPTS